VWASDYYVSSTGNDTQSGSATAPWRTVARVNQQNYYPGDRILFQGGANFSGNLTFTAASKGTPSAPITVTSWGSGRARILAGTGIGFYAYNTAGYLIQSINFVGSGVASSTQSGISFYTDLSGNVKLDTVTVDQVEVSGFYGYGVIFGAWSGATGFTNITLTRVNTHDNGYGGITTYGPQDPNNVWYPHQNIYVGHCIAYNNRGIAGLSGSSGSGIVIGAASGVTIERSQAYGNGSNNTSSTGPFAIWTYDSTRVVVQYNEAHHNHTAGTADGGGFDVDGGVSNSIFQYNYSHDNDGPGILVAQYTGARPQTNNVVRYNISQNDARRNGLGAITVFDTVGSLSGEEIFNNTVFLSGAAQVPSAVQIVGSPRQVHLRNNILFTSGGALTMRLAPNLIGILFQGNDYWNGGAPLSISWGNASWSSVNSWSQATGQEMLNGSSIGLSVAPHLTAPGGGGTIGNSDQLNLLSAYQLVNTSPLIYKGLDLTNVGLAFGPVDFYGIALPQPLGYSIGAAEF